ncbi:MAG: beta-ketoacyl-ACP synthase 3 [Chloroflexi bacterium]|nr:beta-ketoacyl-ACP synthase 3 [Chloroflexota bacterium]
MSKVIIGTGHDLPAQMLTNDDLERIGVGYDRSRSGKTLDEWAMERVGVRSRHRVAPGEGTSDMGTRAAQRALDDAGLRASDLGLIVMSTFSSDYRAPASAGLLQANLGARCKFFQLDAACPGFVDGVITASALMDALEVEYALVVSSDAVSQYCAPDNFMVQCLFGDGAGAAVLRNAPGSAYGVKGMYSAGDGSMGRYLWIPGGGTKEPVSEAMVASGRQYAIWAYKEVYPFAVQKMTESAQFAAQRAGWELDEVAWVIPHQAGRNIIVASARRLEMPEEKFVINMDHTGNTSGASIPIALDETNQAGKLKDGDKLLMPAMGAGLAWGGLAVVWQDYRARA